MSSYAIFAGFIRPMPGVFTFVTPVFIDPNGCHVAQSDPDRSGILKAFERVDTSIGFHEVDFTLGWRTGQALLHAFETSEHSLLIGTAIAVADELEKSLESADTFKRAAKHTHNAIERFIQYAKPYSKDRAHSMQRLYRLRRTGIGSPRILVETASTLIGKLRPNSDDIIEILLAILEENHEIQIEQHGNAIAMMNDLVDLACENPETRQSFMLAVDQVLREKYHAFRSRSLCDYCLNRLHAARENLARTKETGLEKQKPVNRPWGNKEQGAAQSDYQAAKEEAKARIEHYRSLEAAGL